MRVLVVIGTSGFDVHDLCEALAQKGIDCSICHWNAIVDPPGHYDLAVLFGLTEHKVNADLYAGTVRKAVGETPLIVVSTWLPRIMAAHMKEAHNAEYLHRHGPLLDLVDTVVSMLAQSKKAP